VLDPVLEREAEDADRDRAQDDVPALARVALARVPQRPVLLPGTVRSNLELFGPLADITSAQPLPLVLE